MDMECSRSLSRSLRWIIWTWIPVPFLSDIHVKVNNTDPYDNCPGGKMDILKGLEDVINVTF
jgi:hypothetical protein